MTLTTDQPLPRLIAHIDGAARGNPGPAAIGVVIRDQAGATIAEISRTVGRRTNNQAEYEGLLAALNELIRIKADSALICTDSELLFCQMTGRYRVRNRQLLELHRQATGLAVALPGLLFRCIPRDQNKAADRLANQALDNARPVRSSPQQS